MIAIIDYGMGNLRSVFNAFEYLGAQSCITHNESEIASSDRIVLPGVGSFRAAMENIRRKRLEVALNKAADRGIPILGICLGMQILADWGEEDGMTRGLGWIPGRVTKLRASSSHKIPHIGFNRAIVREDAVNFGVLKGLGPDAAFYFVHSYKLCCDRDANIAAETDYGEKFVSAVRHEHIYGVQFHAEKSRNEGLRVLSNFCSI
jgi:glutamine amidotransferase